MKFFLKSAVALFLVAVIFWIAVLGLLQTRQGQEWALSKTLDYIQEKTGTTVEFADIEFDFPLTFRINKLSFLQNKEKLVTVEHLTAACTYGALLEGRIIFSNLSADGINIFKIPSSPDTINKSSWDGTTLPFYIKIENLFLNAIKIDPALTTNMHLPEPLKEIALQSSFSIKGFISNNPFRRGMTSHLLMQIQDPTHADHPIVLMLHTQKKILSVSFEGNHLPPQASSILYLDAKFQFSASGFIPSWVSLLKDEPLQEPLDGFFSIAIRPSKELIPYLSNLTMVDGAFIVQGNRELHLKEAKIKSSLFELIGHAQLDKKLAFHKCQFDGALNCLEKIHPNLSDNKGVSFRGALIGSIFKPSVSLQAFAPSINVKEHVLTSFNAALTSSIINKEFKGSVNVNFDFLQNPVQLAALFRMDDNQISVQEFHAAALKSNLAGNLAYSLQNDTLTGKISFELPFLENWSVFFPEDIHGTAKGDIQFLTQDATKQLLDVKVIAQSIQFQEVYADKIVSSLSFVPADNNLFHVHNTTSVKDIFWNNNTAYSIDIDSTYQTDIVHQKISDLKASLNSKRLSWTGGSADEINVLAEMDGSLKENSGSLRFSLLNLLQGSFLISNLEGESTMANKVAEWPFKLNAAGFWNEHWTSNSEGLWHYNDKALTVDLNQLTGLLGPYPYRLLDPISISKNKQNLLIDKFKIELSDAVFEGTLMKTNENLDLEFATTPIPTELFHFVAPEFPLTGRVSIAGSINSTLSSPEGKMQMLLHNTQFTEEIFTQKPFMEGAINLSFNNKGIALQSSISGIGTSPVTVDGTIPLIVSLDPVDIHLNPNIPFGINVRAEGELDPYLHLFYNDVTNISGQTKIALRLSGQMNDPHIEGSIDLFNGTYESLDTGAMYHDIQARFEGSGSKILLKDFIAHDNKSGSITASGEIQVDKEKDFPFMINVNPKQIYVMESDYANIAISGPLIITGNRHKAVIKGDLKSDEVVVHLEQALPKSVKHIEIQYINEPEGEHRVHKKKLAEFIDLDVNLTLPGNIMIEGKNLSSEWKGNIAVAGNVDEPLLNGDLSLVKGTYNLNGKEFSLTQGNIHFGGLLSKKTTLYIIAGKEIDKIKAEIIVKGPANKPSVSFRSNPPLSQREVMAYILFNRGIADITQDQGDMLSQSFIELNDTAQSNKSYDFLTRFRNNIGLDRLDITTSDSDSQDVSLQAGKYITETVFVSINKSINDVGNRVAVEAKLRKNLKAEAEVEVGGETQGKVSLKWKKDY